MSGMNEQAIKITRVKQQKPRTALPIPWQALDEAITACERLAPTCRFTAELPNRLHVTIFRHWPDGAHADCYLPMDLVREPDVAARFIIGASDRQRRKSEILREVPRLVEVEGTVG